LGPSLEFPWFFTLSWSIRGYATVLSITQERRAFSAKLRPLHNFSWSSSLTIKLYNTAGIEKEGNMSKSFVMNILWWLQISDFSLEFLWLFT